MFNMRETCVRLENVSKMYRKYHRPSYRILEVLFVHDSWRRHFSDEFFALNNVILNVKSGERVAVIGRNGSGKSTLLKIISGIVKPTSGSVEVKGTHTEICQIGAGVEPTMTGRENIEFYVGLRGVHGRQFQTMVDWAIDFAEIHDFLDQPLSTYSTGMTMRVALSATLATTPDILILDEILSVGDSYFTTKIQRHLESLLTSRERILFFVSHNVTYAADLCERMIWIEGGHIVMDDFSPKVCRAYEYFVKCLNQDSESSLKNIESVLQKAVQFKFEMHPTDRNKSVNHGFGAEVLHDCSIDNIPSGSNREGSGPFRIKRVLWRQPNNNADCLITGEETFVDVLVANPAGGKCLDLLFVVGLFREGRINATVFQKLIEVYGDKEIEFRILLPQLLVTKSYYQVIYGLTTRSYQDTLRGRGETLQMNLVFDRVFYKEALFVSEVYEPFTQAVFMQPVA